MRNVTVTLDDEVARWARRRAADQDTSVSRLLGELLRRHMLEEEGYRAAMSRYLARRPEILKRGGRYPGREEVHDRAGLR